ncbi:MAG: DUF4242 domain-containing protein, partial [Gammaproteobacteria bacterium]
MTALVLERDFDPALTKQDVLDLAQQGVWCFEQHRVDWLGSMLSADGAHMVCRFEARDAESIRQALRTLDADTRVIWEATTHEVENP